MKISEAFDLYGEYATIKGYSIRVIEHNQYVKKTLVLALGDKNINEISLKDVFIWRSSMMFRRLPSGKIVKRAPNSIRCDILRLRCVLKHLKIIGQNCLDYELIPIPKRETAKRIFLTEAEIQKMIDCSYSLRNKFIISLLYSSGIRLSEFLSLDRDSIQDMKFTVVGKGKKERLCFIDQRTQILMSQYLKSRKDDDRALVVSNLYKQRMTPSNIQLLIKNSAKRAGIMKHVTPHVLRHSFATNFIKNDGGIRPLSIILGHANLDTTAIYTHLADNELEKKYRQFHTV